MREYNEGVQRVHEYVRQHPGLRIPAISKGLAVPAKTVERWVGQLRNQGQIEFKGSPRKGGYFAVR